jgi:hypothetical protein
MSLGDSEKSTTLGWTAVLMRVIERGDFRFSTDSESLEVSELPKDASSWMAKPSGSTKEQPPY